MICQGAALSNAQGWDYFPLIITCNRYNFGIFEISWLKECYSKINSFHNYIDSQLNTGGLTEALGFCSVGVYEESR